MNFIDNIYKQSLSENQRNLNFWQDYLNNLNDLDFNAFSDKLTVPILVPVGNKILFKGVLKHTNEVTVSLGADYFAKCSIKQAEILRQHRIKGAKSKIDLYKKEKEYLEKQLELNKNTHENIGHEIIEIHTEEEDSLWREKHRERVRQYNQSAEKKKEKNDTEKSDYDLWERLEELELQEELEEEYLSMTNRGDDLVSDNSFIEDEEFIQFPQETKLNEGNTKNAINMSNQIKQYPEESEETKSSKIQILQQVIDRQKNLEFKLSELKNKSRETCKTENDLFKKLDEMEQLDELEDEMDRLEDILNEDSDDTEDTTEEILSTPVSKKTVSFADEDESQTLELRFKHSDVEPNISPYNSDIGITKPSDIYGAFSNLFVDETTSILKKNNYNNTDLIHNNENVSTVSLPEEIEDLRQTIVVKDVIEKAESDEIFNSQQRPVSLFKKRRQQQKT